MSEGVSGSISPGCCQRGRWLAWEGSSCGCCSIYCRQACMHPGMHASNPTPPQPTFPHLAPTPSTPSSPAPSLAPLTPSCTPAGPSQSPACCLSWQTSLPTLPPLSPCPTHPELYTSRSFSKPGTCCMSVGSATSAIGRRRRCIAKIGGSDPHLAGGALHSLNSGRAQGPG